jgi:hypothetical protein
VVRQSCGVEECGLNVGGFKEGVVGEDFFVGCAGGEQFQEVHHAETCSADARPAAALVRVDGNALGALHEANLTKRRRDSKWTAVPPRWSS